MCLGVPAKVLEIRRTDVPCMGTVDFGGVQREICLDWVPDVREGNYVLIHVGFAISVIDEAEAHETLRLLAELGEAGRAEDAARGESLSPPGAPT
jgi:hydrogenase expression/formation protein HypC